jgi:hypothetical protein
MTVGVLSHSCVGGFIIWDWKLRSQVQWMTWYPHVPSSWSGYLLYRAFIFFLYCCAEWGYIVAFTKVLTMYQLYRTWIHPFYHFPLFPVLLINGRISTGIIFSFTCIYTHFLHWIHPLTPFPHNLPAPTGANPPPCVRPVLPSWQPECLSL